MAFNQNKYTSEYKKNNYDEVRVLIPKGKKEKLKEIAMLNQISMSQLILKAIEDCYNIDLTTK